MTMLPPLDDPVAIARALLMCPSVTPADGGALALVEAIAEALGFAGERPVFTAPDTPDVENLFARRGDSGPHLVFAGHTDVVPPGDVARWRHDPFAGAIDDGHLWGRGAVDMKGGIAAFLAAVGRLVRDGRMPEGRVSLLITGDEEGPSINGTPKLLAWALARGERFDAAVVGEPTNPEAIGDAIKVGRRGSLSGTVTVTGQQGHVAYPDLADNPIPKLVRLVAALGDEPLDTGNDRFPPSNLEFVSLDVGNPAWNVIPRDARGRFNVRFNDIWTPATLEAELRARLTRAAGNAVDWELVVERPTSDSFLTRDPGLIDVLAAAVETVTGRRPTLSTSGGTSDARYIKDHCPVVEFGLVGQTMHKIDERVAVADLELLTRVYEAFLVGWFETAAR
ncbi:succinyl-diaminopimelate desuccinylase [Siculibacillus lacustris]|uniref:Succinyl-diaminopimelate desuccinylase n=1 Tax=Siculibacillus lacustris TaxID=1549641 RepID=A0A4V2KTY9_9HYPH|nr:succinyl-diaminopimelate desuccinylase [Siculibacillus lacustris]TBW39275.1 succinyl-diaminopimelate desuccinylase [Siculibacillus lacustris]